MTFAAFRETRSAWHLPRLAESNKEHAMAHHRDFDIEMTIVPDVAGQYEAAFVVHEPHGKHAARHEGKHDEHDEKHAGKHGGKHEAKHEGKHGDIQHGDAHEGRYAFPPVGSYLTPDDAREQTMAWVRKWIDANFPK
jgi:hypothetical protein